MRDEDAKAINKAFKKVGKTISELAKELERVLVTAFNNLEEGLRRTTAIRSGFDTYEDRNGVIKVARDLEAGEPFFIDPKHIDKIKERSIDK